MSLVFIVNIIGVLNPEENWKKMRCCRRDVGIPSSVTSPAVLVMLAKK